MDCSVPGFPFHHQFPELTQTHVYQSCHPTISSSVVPFSSCLQSFPASGSFQMSQFFASGGQSIGASASAPVLPMNIQGWFPLGLTGWISLQSKGHLRVFSSTTVRRHQFFGTQPSDTLTSVYDYWILIQLMQGGLKLPIFCQILNFDNKFLFENVAIIYLLSYTHKIYKGKLQAATQFISIWQRLCLQLSSSPWNKWAVGKSL